ncbi:unnamed protein product [Prunus armeniaca]|uniref:SKP1-like protein n=1 Tax=Prunus armeniaca TaxID=36596 RepID=A0A6J5UQF9_PRUAR|nr:hypothetical protein GBA52_012270 [Prunus armeniaca]CAB4276268.1 unnamed protein product [Prunus armeniaca]
MSSSKSRVFRLRCSNDEIIEVNEAAAVLCETIKNLVEEGCEGDEISVPNVTAEILGKVMEWCKTHAKGKETKEELEEWDAEFLNVDQAVLYHILIAADYLYNKELVAQVTQKVADMIKGKKSDEIREVFKLKNDMPPELVKEIIDGNPSVDFM